ncbi:MAG TPA: M56 family metallopeptidase [Sphingomicrobium sp.]|nr:M56 family metallopeptidase [Sphingomicrobium sp.]
MLIALAAKSLIIGAVALGLLKLARNRSATDRSWIAHLGLGALLLLPLSLALPALEVTAPALLASGPADFITTPATATADPASLSDAPSAAPAAEPINWLLLAYIIPSAVFFLLTLIALMRLIPLKSRATVLVDPHWLSALAHAQRRMGFKNGTALLASEELVSPISWGLMRPTILLSREAIEAPGDAEAIIAHELAHVARFDWAKLMLARVAIALFWFNPLVWLLAREAHQLREEAADDAVLGSDIEGTQYASLLVGIARHECRGLLIGAHGVAPGRKSLARRVKRVLDVASMRRPGGWRWSSAVAIFAAGAAVPIAVLSFVPALPDGPGNAGPTRNATAPAKIVPATVPTGALGLNPATPQIATASGAIPVPPARAEGAYSRFDRSPPAIPGTEFAAALSSRIDATLAARLEGRKPPFGPGRDDDFTAAAIHGVTPAYASAIKAASPGLANATTRDLVGMKIQGVTPATVREFASLGVARLTPRTVTAAAIQNVDPGFVRAMAGAGFRNLPLDRLTEMKMFGVTPAYANQMRRAYPQLDASDLIRSRMHGIPPPE